MASRPGPKAEVKGKAVKGEPIVFETVGNKLVKCEVNAKLTGAFTTAKLISNIQIHFTGCKNFNPNTCQNVGAKAGNITTTVAHRPAGDHQNRTRSQGRPGWLRDRGSGQRDLHGIRMRRNAVRVPG